MPESSFGIEPTAKTDPDDTTLVLLLPGYRDAYAPNDYRDYQQRCNDDAMVDYVVREAQHKRRPHHINIALQLPGGVRDPQGEAATEQAYRQLLTDYAENATSSSLMVIPKSIVLVVLGLAVLIVSHYVGNSGHGDTNSETIVSAASDVVQVGAWVMLWTAFSGFFFEGGTKGRRAATLRKLAKAPIYVRYDDD